MRVYPENNRNASPRADYFHTKLCVCRERDHHMMVYLTIMEPTVISNPINMPSNAPMEVVEPGAFTVYKSTGKVLKAYLGVCVGVAICDREAKVGGLYHILLPEPSKESFNGDPEIYASTGLPLFIQALVDAGADKNKMEAAIAGGALVGTVTMDDLQYDIGGRTAEIVRATLRNEGVHIEQSETGGYFSCRMLLNLNTLNCTVDPIGEIEVNSVCQSNKLLPEDIDGAINRTRPIPQTALKIIRLIYSKDYNMTEIANEVRKDQIISAKVIKISNSVVNSPVRVIDSIDKALVMLGEKMILQLVVSSSVELFFQHSNRGYSLCKGGLYHHALGTARVAEKLAEFTRKVPADVAYTGGLLHDIGKVVLDQSVAHIHPLFYRRIYTEKADLIEVEKDLLGISHPEVGMRLSKLWGLPENLMETIAYHHEPEKARGPSELIHLIHIADLLTSRFNTGKVVEKDCADLIGPRLNRLGVPPNRFIELLEYIPWKIIGTPIGSETI